MDAALVERTEWESWGDGGRAGTGVSGPPHHVAAPPLLPVSLHLEHYRAFQPSRADGFAMPENRQAIT
jgi:hypothetical protein